jgi:hypothetical protein
VRWVITLSPNLPLGDMICRQFRVNLRGGGSRAISTSRPCVKYPISLQCATQIFGPGRAT